MRVPGGALVPMLILATFALAAVPGAPADPGTQDATVQVSNFAFTPATVVLQAGDQVTWQWTSGTHSVETSDGSEEWCSTRSSGSCVKGFPSPGTYDYRCGVHPSMQATVVVEGEAPVVTFQAPDDGTEVEDAFTASGTATHSTGIAAVAWRVDGGSYTPVDTLQGTDWSTLVPIDGLAAGGHTLTIRATATDGATGLATRTFRIAAPDAVDLRVAGLTVQNSIQTVQLRATVQNAGTIDVSDALLRFEYEHHGTWRTIDTMVLDVRAGAALSRAVVWDAEGKIGAFPVRAVVDPDGVIAESDETNNQRSAQAAFGSALIPGFDPNEPI